ncbi:MAG TPA: hypothetical protein VJ912_04195 [Candidatus Nanoarchaeia archaeon]|nr:hypothetical protein [Candidatus Nanoarchaeia archaeon]
MGLEDIRELDIENDLDEVNEKLNQGWVLVDIIRKEKKIPYNKRELIEKFNYNPDQIKNVIYKDIRETQYLLGRLKE